MHILHTPTYSHAFILTVYYKETKENKNERKKSHTNKYQEHLNLCA